MQSLAQEFIEFSIEKKILCFGDFQTKAGRQSPYFFNAGLFNTGALIDALGAFYARKLVAAKERGEINFDMIYGPAYKGIPLAIAITINLAKLGHDIPWAFNRKEAKDHGEGGIFVGTPLKGKVLIVDDVISAGTSVRESVELIQKAGATPAGVMIALDRQERSGTDSCSAVQSVEQHYKFPVLSIAKLDDLLAYLETDGHYAQAAKPFLAVIREYRQRYGTSQA